VPAQDGGSQQSESETRYSSGRYQGITSSSRGDVAQSMEFKAGMTGSGTQGFLSQSNTLQKGQPGMTGLGNQLANNTRKFG
jgi:hypothetical protein